MSVVIETTIGDITVDLNLDERPRTCLNFIKLCKIKYYNFCLFHKIERNFIAQSGDPSGTGRGGESIFQHLYGEQAKYFDVELKPRIKHKKLGTLSMVNNGDNMNGSQFFITLGEDLTFLDEQHSVFGEVVEGFEILMKLNDTICDTSNRPYQDIRITHTVILHDPYEDPSDLDIPPSSPIPTDDILASDYVRADEDIEDNKGKSLQEIEEEIKDKEAKARATILEMVGDIPDAEVKPPENVLFVCKLNPVTTDEDLEIIFSRFGVIKSCEVIKDNKTGESLQYAFIEFEREDECETAYFKMDNVLIDDRRIHVDFSQSVSKLKFDKHNRPIIDSRKRTSRENLIIKDKSRNTGNYEMIFDSDDDRTTLKKTKKNSKKSSESPQKMYRSKSPLSKKSKTFNRKRGHSPSSYLAETESSSQQLSKHSYLPSRKQFSYREKHRSRSSSPYSSRNRSLSSPRKFSHQASRKHSQIFHESKSPPYSSRRHSQSPHRKPAHRSSKNNSSSSSLHRSRKHSPIPLRKPTHRSSKNSSSSSPSPHLSRKHSQSPLRKPAPRSSKNNSSSSPSPHLSRKHSPIPLRKPTHRSSKNNSPSSSSPHLSRKHTQNPHRKPAPRSSKDNSSSSPSPHRSRKHSQSPLRKFSHHTLKKNSSNSYESKHTHRTLKNSPNNDQRYQSSLSKSSKSKHDDESVKYKLKKMRTYSSSPEYSSQKKIKHKKSHHK